MLWMVWHIFVLDTVTYDNILIVISDFFLAYPHSPKPQNPLMKYLSNESFLIIIIFNQNIK